MDKAKIARLQAAVKIGGKGAPKRKVIKTSSASSHSNDVKLHAALKKLNVAPIPTVEEVNMFQEDGQVLHFSAPQVHAALGSNVTAIYGGQPKVKDLAELVPGILSQLGPESLASLRKLAEAYQQMESQQQATGAGKAPEGDDEDDVPELVDNFDEAGEKEEGSKLDELN
ncbi:nascent polypeptide-associated complex subunit beta [Phaffia rhodozyma]|uniref:Nascent polypeptide-associated complex subunit beta n=1 Tax=Phaffia rhodozyma TaxID=264483 RepID=A0A0F7SP57_PHARH|nr:nascent polypeptide-associated complex subunit beta [Phaffia rhodozyma]